MLSREYDAHLIVTVPLSPIDINGYKRTARASSRNVKVIVGLTCYLCVYVRGGGGRG